MFLFLHFNQWNNYWFSINLIYCPSVMKYECFKKKTWPPALLPCGLKQPQRAKLNSWWWGHWNRIHPISALMNPMYEILSSAISWNSHAVAIFVKKSVKIDNFILSFIFLNFIVIMFLLSSFTLSIKWKSTEMPNDSKSFRSAL